MTASTIRQNFHPETEAGINKQINLELYSSYVYLSMSFYFQREDKALQGFAKFFKKLSDEEREHARKLMKLQNDRGGRIVLQMIQKPEKDEWGTGLDAMQAALVLEKNCNQSLMDLHEIAGKHNDSHLTNILEGEFMNPMVDMIKLLGDHIANIKRVGAGLGEYIFDKETLDGEKAEGN